MPANTQSIVTSLFLSMFFLSCGGAHPVVESPAEEAPPAQLTADDYYRAELMSGEFTDEVDEKRYRAVGDNLDRVPSRARIVYFVGKLRRVPPHARIEVRWYNDRMADPQVVSDVYGSDTFSFISSFTPPGRTFIPGNYTLRVFVNDREVGSRSFVIEGKDPFRDGITVSKVAVSKKLHPKNDRPIKPARRFARATQLYVSFKVSNVLESGELDIVWTRGTTVFNESTVHVNGNGRYNATIASSGGLPRGAYTVSINLDGATLGDTRFAIGNASLGPIVDQINIGTRLDKNGMPAPHKTVFTGTVSQLYCGVRFLDVDADSEILVEWIHMEGRSESVYHQVVTPIPGGGSGTMSAVWAPKKIYPGRYKAAVFINGEPAKEQAFEVR